MTRRPAAITQAEVARALRAAKKVGATEVEVRVGEAKIVIRLSTATGTGALEDGGEIVL